MSTPHDPVTSVNAARALEGLGSVEVTVNVAASLAVELVKGADYACVSVLTTRTGEVQPAFTSADIGRLDTLQHELDEGPCITDIYETDVVSSPDLRSEPRWPNWARTATAHSPARSLLCLRLFTRDRHLGTLTLYSDTADGFDGRDFDTAADFSAHLAVAINTTQAIENLERGLESRTIVGQAQGILMVKLDISGPQAFAYMRRISQDTNQKLIHVATDIVARKGLPTPPSSGPPP